MSQPIVNNRNTQKWTPRTPYKMRWGKHHCIKALTQIGQTKQFEQVLLGILVSINNSNKFKAPKWNLVYRLETVSIADTTTLSCFHTVHMLHTKEVTVHGLISFISTTNPFQSYTKILLLSAPSTVRNSLPLA